MQQAHHRPPAQRHRPALADGLADGGHRPEGEAELELPRVFGRHRLVHPPHRDGAQFVLTPAALPGLEVLPPAMPVEREPVVDGGAAHPQSRRDPLGRLAALHHHHPTPAHLGEGLRIKGSEIAFRRFHARILARSP